MAHYWHGHESVDAYLRARSFDERQARVARAKRRAAELRRDRTRSALVCSYFDADECCANSATTQNGAGSLRCHRHRDA